MAGFGLYIHWPFCQSKCPYCDFNSHVVSDIDENRWVRAYIDEIHRTGRETKDRVLNSVFFGGGTPSLMHPDTVSAILDAVRNTWRLSNNPEITLEANPTSVEAGRFQGYRDAGVNRVSIGVQAMNDTDLRALGRLHSVSEARAAIDVAERTFERFSFDLIYARQNQSLADWRAELTDILVDEPHHLSLYQLTIEDGTVFGNRLKKGGLQGLPLEDAAADMYDVTQELCEAAGLNAYEVSNHALPGEESIHNRIYWTGGDYVGIGPGAHGRVTLNGQRFATDTPLAPMKWLSQVETSRSGESKRSPLTPRDQANELLMMGLRLSEGVSLTALHDLDPDVAKIKKIEYLQDIGMVSLKGQSLVTTAKGRLVLNAVIGELFSEP